MRARGGATYACRRMIDTTILNIIIIIMYVHRDAMHPVLQEVGPHQWSGWLVMRDLVRMRKLRGGMRARAIEK